MERKNEPITYSKKKGSRRGEKRKGRRGEKVKREKGKKKRKEEKIDIYLSEGKGVKKNKTKRRDKGGKQGKAIGPLMHQGKKSLENRKESKSH